MKQCPKCRSTYTDETLGFCLADGTGLVAVLDEQATFVRQSSEPLRVELPQTAASVQLAPASQPTRTSGGLLKILLAAAALGLLLMVGVAGLGALYYFRSGTPSSNETVKISENSQVKSNKNAGLSNLTPSINEDAPLANDPGDDEPKTKTPDPLANDPVVQNAKNSPDDFDAQMEAGEKYYALERFDDAVRYLKRAHQLNPADRKVVVQLGNACFDGEHYVEAEKWYTAALETNSDDVAVRTDLGLTFVFRDPPDYDRAIQEFNSSLEIDPAHVQTLQNLTVAYTKTGDSLNASVTLARLMHADPKNKAIAKLRQDIQKIGN